MAGPFDDIPQKSAVLDEANPFADIPAAGASEAAANPFADIPMAGESMTVRPRGAADLLAKSGPARMVAAVPQAAKGVQDAVASKDPRKLAQAVLNLARSEGQAVKELGEFSLKPLIPEKTINKVKANDRIVRSIGKATKESVSGIAGRAFSMTGAAPSVNMVFQGIGAMEDQKVGEFMIDLAADETSPAALIADLFIFFKPLQRALQARRSAKAITETVEAIPEVQQQLKLLTFQPTKKTPNLGVLVEEAPEAALERVTKELDSLTQVGESLKRRATNVRTADILEESTRTQRRISELQKEQQRLTGEIETAGRIPTALDVANKRAEKIADESRGFVIKVPASQAVESNFGVKAGDLVGKQADDAKLALDLAAETPHPGSKVGVRVERAAGGSKPTRFAERVATDPETPEEMRSAINSFYDPAANKQTLGMANQRVNLDPDAAFRYARDSDYSAESAATGIVLIKKLRAEGRLDEAIELAETLSEKGTMTGQANQIFSFWNKLGPDGILRHAATVFARVNRARSEVIKRIPRRKETVGKSIQDLFKDAL